MKTTSIPCFSSRSRVRAGLAGALILALTSAHSPRLAAQSLDFNAGNDTGWTRYALPNLPGFNGAATFSFPADDAGGKAYKIAAPPTLDDPYGVKNARAGGYRAEVSYTGRFSAGVDLLAWNATWRQEAGLLYYFQDAGLGTSDGYSATYSSVYHTLYLSQINDEVETTVGKLEDGSVVLDPTHRYRLVVSSHDGGTFLFQLFDKSQPGSPWTSTIGQDSAYRAGLCGLFVFEHDYPSATQGAEATFDNYVAAVPAPNSLPATVTDLSPQPAGKSTAVYPTVTVGILDRDTSVNPASIVLCLDGVWIPNASLTIDPQVHRPSNPSSFPRDFSGATATYALTTLLPWGSTHTNIVAFADSAGAWQTNTWTWTSAYPCLFASNSLPMGSLSVRGFDTRMAQSDNDGVTLANSLDRARQQLAIPPQIPVDRTATSIVQVLSWDKTGTPTNVPGLCGGTYINIAVESRAYLELAAGLHRFRIDTDDRAGVYSDFPGAGAGATILWENSGDTANSTFDFMVEAAGLYPIRCLWEETGGSSHLYLRSVDLNDLSETLISETGDPVGVVKAWYPMVCLSSSSVTGPYTVAAAAVNALNTLDLVGGDCGPAVVGQMVTGGTFTVPISASARFYCLDGPRKTKITNFSKGAASVVITYQVP